MMGQLPTASWARPSFRPSTKAPTSSSVLNREKLTRRALCTCSLGRPMDSSTWLGLALPQAERS